MGGVVTIEQLRKARAKLRRNLKVIDLPLEPQELPPEMKIRVNVKLVDGDVAVSLDKVRGSQDYDIFQLWSALFYAQMRVEQAMDEDED